MARSTIRLAIRYLLIPAAIVALFLGVTSDGHRTATLTPKPSVIAAQLGSRHSLPNGTRLTFGDPAKPTTVTYTTRKGVVIKQPHGKTFASAFADGFGQLGKLLSEVGVSVARATTAESPAPSSTSKR